MTDGGITLKEQGSKQITAALDRLASADERLNLMEDVGAYGVSSTHQRFDEKKSPDGKAWKVSHRAKEVNGQTLSKTSRLFWSFTYAATKSGVEWGTAVQYAGIHQFGGIIKPKTKKALAFHLANGQFVMVKQVVMPARPMLGLNEYDRGRIDGIGVNWLTEVVTP